MTIVISNINKKDQGSLVLTCDVELVPWGLVLKEVCYFEKGQNAWVGMPRKSWKEQDGQWNHKELVQFKEPDVKAKFQKAVVEEIKKAIEKGIDESFKMEEQIPF